ncbi:ParB/RepB/Spo0J family partition protein [Streptomyces sp. NPDC000151]|uniref:ParB/RepB/Spo0J family partition protein n=1 Tax=Streptomyces sp. NPDC000151 TaxID=3154244 RepID=UPI00331DC2F7
MTSIGKPDGDGRPGSATVESVPIDRLKPSDSPRGGSCDESHVRALADSGREFEAIVVHRPTMRVIDGMHRLRAARLRGHHAIAVRFFDGSEADAYVLSVQLNVRHGLPLSRAERRAAAERILRTHPHWSDRAIAERTGLSGKTVGKLRGCASAEIPQPHTRVGRDGTVRPVSSLDGRLRAAGLIAADPTASLRELARRSGLSTATVRDVRDRLRRGEDPVPGGGRGSGGPLARTNAPAGPSLRLDAGSGTGEGEERPDPVATAVRKLVKDPSLKGSEPGRQLLRALLATELTPHQWRRIAAALPGHCAPLVRTVAAQRAAEWNALADAVPPRVQGAA